MVSRGVPRGCGEVFCVRWGVSLVLNKVCHRVPELVRIRMSSLNVLHTTGRAYIVEDIDIFINARKNA